LYPDRIPRGRVPRLVSLFGRVEIRLTTDTPFGSESLLFGLDSTLPDPGILSSRLGTASLFARLIDFLESAS